MKKIIITGGLGYKGSVLTNKLLKLGHSVTVIDSNWFGNYLEEHPKLEVIEQDTRNIDLLPKFNADVVVHLAAVANDPSSEINSKLTWETSPLATMRLLEKMKKDQVNQIIYASSGSVYGVKDEEKVTEDLELVPITDYNKSKMITERLLLSYKNDFQIQIIRPATVCGISPRMRFDISVNLLTIHALQNNLITVFGGNQIRPNIHIDDITDLYIDCINDPFKYDGIYNCSCENMSILEVAELVASETGADIKITSSNDPRSYRMCNDKLIDAGFSPKKTVLDAIKEIKLSFEEHLIRDDEKFHNVKWMKKNIDSIIK
tara:strand:+ start:8413 stop:9366 length:954 start_codon:yes stop_codon:yes gene_type:complete